LYYNVISQTVKDVFVALCTLPGKSKEVQRDTAITLPSLQEACRRYEVIYKKYVIYIYIAIYLYVCMYHAAVAAGGQLPL
jgi:hypothetical protein